MGLIWPGTQLAITSKGDLVISNATLVEYDKPLKWEQKEALTVGPPQRGNENMPEQQLGWVVEISQKQQC